MRISFSTNSRSFSGSSLEKRHTGARLSAPFLRACACENAQAWLSRSLPSGNGGLTPRGFSCDARARQIGPSKKLCVSTNAPNPVIYCRKELKHLGGRPPDSIAPNWSGTVPYRRATVRLGAGTDQGYEFRFEIGSWSRTCEIFADFQLR